MDVVVHDPAVGEHAEAGEVDQGEGEFEACLFEGDSLELGFGLLVALDFDTHATAVASEVPVC